jgi:hypothetical protein
MTFAAVMGDSSRVWENTHNLAVVCVARNVGIPNSRHSRQQSLAFSPLMNI